MHLHVVFRSHSGYQFVRVFVRCVWKEERTQEGGKKWRHFFSGSFSGLCMACLARAKWSKPRRKSHPDMEKWENIFVAPIAAVDWLTGWLAGWLSVAMCSQANLDTIRLQSVDRARSLGPCHTPQFEPRNWLLPFQDLRSIKIFVFLVASLCLKCASSFSFNKQKKQCSQLTIVFFESSLKCSL